VSVAAGSYHDSAGFAGTAGSTAAFTVDTVTPAVSLSIDNTDVNVADGTGTVTFAFSEAPTSFALADTSAVGGTLSNLQQTDATHYTATFTGVDRPADGESLRCSISSVMAMRRRKTPTNCLSASHRPWRRAGAARCRPLRPCRHWSSRPFHCR
jgi:hypothetical protein